MIAFQASLILSGNLAWLNWLTVLMAVACFDDAFLVKCFTLSRFRILGILRLQKYLNLPVTRVRNGVFCGMIIFGLVGLFLSIEPGLNLLSQNQRMNTSFNNLHLINSYGAFGSIGRIRNEIVISVAGGDNSIEGDGQNKGSNLNWVELEFPCKPGDVRASPCVITPYHYRLDWQIWFSAMRREISELWLLRLALKVLEKNETILSHFKNKDNLPKDIRFLKMDLYRYEFTSWGHRNWWKRTFQKSYMPTVSLDQLQTWR